LQEEAKVAEEFAHVITSSDLSHEDVNQILDDHARSVHLLRIRQGDERKRLMDRLEAKRHARRTAAATDVDFDEQGDDDDRVSTTRVGHKNRPSDYAVYTALHSWLY